MKNQNTDHLLIFIYTLDSFKNVFLECSQYEYGRNCKERCSDHCYNKDICDPFFGNCSKCADGYQNAKCDKSKFSIVLFFT